MINHQITAIQERITTLRNTKNLTKLDEFLIEVWERNVGILTNQE